MSVPAPGPRTPSPESRLLRVLGTTFGLAIAVGATVGGGILRTPGEIAGALPNPVLYMAVWVFGAAYTLLGANIFSELGAMMPSAGGPYVFARRAFGDGVGFFVGYADWINWCLGPVVLSLIAGEYMGALFPALAGHAMTVAFATIAILVVLQWIGVKSAGRTQEIITALKALALVALVIAAFTLPHAELAGTAAPVPGGLSLLFALGLAMQGIVFTYDSYYMVVYCGEEVRDPGREIPRSMFRGVWLIILIYMLVNAAFLYVLPIGRMAGDPFVGGSMAEAIFGPRGDTIIRLIMIISVLGTINAELMAIPRILLAMSRDGLFPRQATRINAGGTPAVALGISLLVVTGFLLTGSFEVVLAFDALLILVLYLFSFMALFALRRREPDTPRPYRAWGYPVVPGITVAIGLGLVIAMATGDVKSAIVVFGVLVLSWPASRVARQLNRRVDRGRE